LDPQEPSKPVEGSSASRKLRFEPEPFGKYFLIDRIAVGGMAEVFRARTFGHGGFEKELVIKRILPHLTVNEDFVGMFVDEAKLTVLLQHPNIVQVYDFGKIRDHYYLAMEGIYGKDLKILMRSLAQQQKRLPMQFAAYVAHEMTRGLYYAHTKKDENGKELEIVHRDVSPSNILMTYDGHIKLVDFGIAKASKSQFENTEEGVLKGKFEYMSPEQAQGKAVDQRSDVFACGICLWEMIAGARLFKEETPLKTLERIRNGDVPDIKQHNPGVPRPLEHIVQRALNPRPWNRYQDAEEMRHELEEYIKPATVSEMQLEFQDWFQDLYSQDREAEQARLEQARKAAAALASMEENLELDLMDDEVDTIDDEDEDDVDLAPEPRKKRIPGLVWIALVLVLVCGAGALVKFVILAPDDPVEIPAEPTTGTLMLTIAPAEASDAVVTLNGDKITLPYDQLEPDKPYTLVVTKEGYLPYEDQFKVEAGEKVRLRATLQLEEVATPEEPETATEEEATPAEPGPPAIVFRSSPPGAKVSIEGGPQGRTSPFRFDSGTPGRSYKATYTLDGYKDGSSSARYPQEGTVVSRGTLEKLPDKVEPAYLTINATPWAEVYVDGRKVGTTPIGSLEVEPGDHVVKLVCPPLEAERTIPVTLAPGEKKPVSADLEE